MDWSVDDSGSVVRLIQIYTHPHTHTHKEKANLRLKYVHPVVSPPNQFGFYITVSERMHCDVYNWPARAHTHKLTNMWISHKMMITQVIFHILNIINPINFIFYRKFPKNTEHLTHKTSESWNFRAHCYHCAYIYSENAESSSCLTSSDFHFNHPHWIYIERVYGHRLRAFLGRLVSSSFFLVFVLPSSSLNVLTVY